MFEVMPHSLVTKWIAATRLILFVVTYNRTIFNLKCIVVLFTYARLMKTILINWWFSFLFDHLLVATIQYLLYPFINVYSTVLQQAVLKTVLVSVSNSLTMIILLNIFFVDYTIDLLFTVGSLIAVMLIWLKLMFCLIKQQNINLFA